MVVVLLQIEVSDKNDLTQYVQAQIYINSYGQTKLEAAFLANELQPIEYERY